MLGVRRITTSVDEGHSLWVVLVIVVAAVIVPTACVLWFMNEAVRNVRLAVQQKLTDAYRAQLDDAPTVINAWWEDNYTFEGFKVLSAHDGDRGLRAALDKRPDLVILDIMLPKMNEYEVCRQIRADGLDVPIVMLTAKDQESDIVLGLNLGADDYVTKPFSIKELIARSRAFLRRRHWAEQQVYRFGAFELDLNSHRLMDQGRDIQMTPKEFAMLAYLLRHRGRALTRDELLQAVWGRGVFVTFRSVDRCITTLRKKLEKNARRPEFILTIREIGYRFAFPE